MKNISLAITILVGLMLSACSTTKTETGREASARSGVEQKALSSAIENAFKDVDLKLVNGKKVFLETKSLSKTDIEFINGFLAGQILQKGGFIVTDEKLADLKVYNIVKVSGTDEISRKILSDQVRGEYKGTLSILDLNLSKVLVTFNLFGESSESR